MYKRPLVYSCTRRVPAVCRHGRRSFVFPAEWKSQAVHIAARSAAHTRTSSCVPWWVATRRPSVALARASSPFVKTLYCRPPGAVFKARTRMYTGRKSAPLQFYTYITRAVWVLWLPARGEKICDRTRRHVHVLSVFSASPPPRTRSPLGLLEQRRPVRRSLKRSVLSKADVQVAFFPTLVFRDFYIHPLAENAAHAICAREHNLQSALLSGDDI